MKKTILIFSTLLLFLTGCELLDQLVNKKIDEINVDVPEVTIDNHKIDDAVNDFVDNVAKEQLYVIKGKVDEQVEIAMEKIIDNYNVTDFHYAVTFGDNSTMYETKENFQEIGNMSIYAFDSDAEPIVEARSFNSAGELFYVTGHYEAAEESFKEALQAYQNLEMVDSSEAILCMNNLGLLYLTMGKYKSSEEYLTQALYFRKKNFQDTTGYAATLNNFGVLYQNQGKYNEAEKYLKQASNFISENVGEQSIQYAIVLNNIAMLYQDVNRNADAEFVLNKALEITKNQSKKESATYVRMSVNLALLYQATGRFPEAEKIFKDAIEKRKLRLGTKHPDNAVLLRNLASLYMQMEKYDEVEGLLVEAREIYAEKIGVESPQIAKTDFEIGAYYLAIGNNDSAKVSFERAIKVQEKTLEKRHPDLTESYEYLAINYWAQQKPKEARNYYKKALDNYIFQVNTYFEAMSDAEKALFWTNVQPKFIRYYNFGAENYEQIPEIASDMYTYHIQTKALLLSSSRKVKDRILKSNNQELIDKYNNWTDLKNYTAKLYSLSNEELETRKINLDSLINVTNTLEKEIASLSSDFKLSSEQKSITFNEIKAHLDDKEAVVEIIRIDNYDKLRKTENISYIALVADNMSIDPKVVVFENGSSMETTYSQEYQKAIMNGKDMDKFYGYYWEGIDKALGNDEKIFLSVDGIYNQVNVNTIKLPNDKYVIDEKNILFLTNSKDLLPLKERMSKPANLTAKNATLIGFPDYLMDLPADFSFVPPLPGTKVEVENINSKLNEKNWNTTVYIGREATETNLKKISNPFVLHIATHGYFLETTGGNVDDARSFGVNPSRAVENPLLRSGLLLAGADETVLEINLNDNSENDDGILNAYEAMTMNLDQTQLVVLSACQTGLGEIKTGEGVYGLQRSFQIAGARSIITSLWEVSDEGTQDLMSAFYKYWLDSGDEYEAFRKARLEIKEKYKYPYFWGAFVLIGK